MKYNGISATYISNSTPQFDESHVIDNEARLYVLTHGSKHTSGAWAAQLVSNIIAETVKRHLHLLPPAHLLGIEQGRNKGMAILAESVRLASKTLIQEIRKDPKKSGVWATVVAVLCYEDYAVIAHVGNGRAYLIRDQIPIQLTKDHTLFQEMVEAGEESFNKINPDFKKVLTRTLGVSDALLVSMRIAALSPGDELLLCSKGFSEYFSNHGEEFQNVIRDNRTSDKLSFAMTQLLSKTQSRDHSTLINISIAETAAFSARPDYMDIKDKIEVLKTLPLFRGVWGLPDELSKMAQLFTLRDIPQGTEIVHEGDSSDEMYIVMNGKANISYNGQSFTTVDRLGLIGEMGFLTQKKRTATATAMVDTRLLVLNKQDFYKLLKFDKDLVIKFAFGVIDDLAKKLTNNSVEMSHMKELANGKKVA